MRWLIFLLINLVTSSAQANSICNISNSKIVVTGWTGNCNEGMADGYGVLNFRDNDPVKTQTFIGYFIKGIPSGPHINIGQESKIMVVVYFNNGNRDDGFPTHYIDNNSRQLKLSNSVFYDDATRDSKGNPVSIPYQSVINAIYTYVSSKNYSDTEFKLFKDYLEGKVRVTGDDDPLVFGAALKPNGG